MAKLTTYAGIICLLGCIYAVFGDALLCDDIDTSACHLLIIQRPNLCSDANLANTACKRFCKLCPIECYHCDAAVLDYHDCNNTKLCQLGEVCMRKELLSYVDGHHEYQMTCEKKELCDGGADLSLSFGKRDVKSRDVTIQCCLDDLCNYPELPTTPSTTTTTTTTSAGCKRDIIILVDESRSMMADEGSVLSFISNLVTSLNIGTDGSLVSMATFAASATDRWDLDRYTNVIDLKHAINTMTFHGGNGDANAALSYAISHASSSQIGDRPQVPDVFILITDDDAGSLFRERVLVNQLHQLIDDIITIGVGPNVGLSELGLIATDSGHVIQVRHARDLQRYEQQMVSLICQSSLIP